MEYLKKFDNIGDYNKESIIAPNVSLIEDESYCKYKSLTKSNIGDIVLFDSKTNDYIFISPEAYKEGYWMDLSYTPIGVVAVSTKYTPDGSTRVCSLVNMSMKTPETGTAIAKPIEGDNYMYWGGNGIDLPLPNTTYTNKVNPLTGELTGKDTWLRLPSDQKFNNTGYVDPLSGCYYYFNNYVGDPNFTGENKEDKFGPYPVLKNGEKNPLYYAEGMATNDFNGPSNTDIIIKAAEGTKYSNWNTVPTITHNYEAGNYPPAFCCKRFHTPGTNAGDWYLPAIGEAMFLNTHYGKINSGLLAINEKLGSDYSIKIGRDGNFGYWYWSSSEYSSTVSRNVNTLGGYVGTYNKSNTHTSNRVRAFLRFF